VNGPVGGSGATERVSTASVPAKKATAIARRARGDWQQILEANARNDPSAQFDNLTKDEFLARVREAAAEYDFQVVGVRWLEPVQAAPLLVVQAEDPRRFAQDVPAVLRSLDPQAPVGEDWEGRAFEGFFFEARDARGVPFLAVFNHWRGSDRGGGQWARGEDLYPFEHG
jgi:hypothetical protein